MKSFPTYSAAKRHGDGLVGELAMGSQVTLPIPAAKWRCSDVNLSCWRATFPIDALGQFLASITRDSRMLPVASEP